MINSIKFTSFGITGNKGPSKEKLSYFETNNYLGIVGEGIHKWRVPSTNVYPIEAAGASGQTQCPGNVGGKGAKYTASFHLKKDDILYILVGQTGIKLNPNFGGAGGGATFITKQVQSSSYFFQVDSCYIEPLLVAAGGGGSGDCNSGTTDKNGEGGSCDILDEGAGISDQIDSTGGAGFVTSSGNTSSFLLGGTGGFDYSTTYNTTVYGGFGCGGAPWDVGGGGGGFKGGDSGEIQNENAGGGKGGYSYNSGKKISCIPNFNEGNGYALIIQDKFIASCKNCYISLPNIVVIVIIIVITK